MSIGSHAQRLEELVALCHELGREDRHMAVLGEGNVSTRAGGAGAFLIKASGRRLSTLARADVVLCRGGGILELLERDERNDAAVESALMASRVDPAAPKPSVEAIFHAYLLGLDGVEWVGHTHPVAVNALMCSPRAEEFAARRLFPDEVVCCGEESAYVPYADPGRGLARAIRQETESFVRRRGRPPRVTLLGNHGVITIGRTASAVLGAMLMVKKAAETWLGAAALGGPRFLDEAEVRRIAGREDEHHRQRALGL